MLKYRGRNTPVARTTTAIAIVKIRENVCLYGKKSRKVREKERVRERDSVKGRK